MCNFMVIAVILTVATIAVVFAILTHRLHSGVFHLHSLGSGRLRVGSAAGPLLRRAVCAPDPRAARRGRLAHAEEAHVETMLFGGLDQLVRSKLLHAYRAFQGE